MKSTHLRNLLPKGSVLVFSLLILSILLVTALTILSSALLDRKASLSTSTSARSFQVADSGVEEVLFQIYKGSHATLEDLGDAIVGGNPMLDHCTLSGTVPQVKFPSAGGEVTVSFYEGETTPYADGCTGPDWRERVVKIKSEGVSGSNARAVEVAVAAATGGPLEAKAWVSWGSGVILVENNVASVTGGNMNPVITFDTALSSAQYVVVCNATLGAGAEEQVFAYNKSTTSFNLAAAHASGADAIGAFDCVVFGN